MSDTLKPVSIYTIFAQLFSAVAKEVAEEFGDKGQEAIRRGVKNFGTKRGQTIAQNAKSDGKPNTLENYLPYYDMERSDLFVYDTTQTDTVIDQKFHTCPFASAWIESGQQELGKLYCDEIDAAIAQGFNKNLIHEEKTHLLNGDKCCHMTFTMKKED